MKPKLIRHRWKVVETAPPLKDYKECSICGLQKWYSFEFEKTIYYNPRTGIYSHYTTPKCIYPNTKL